MTDIAILALEQENSRLRELLGMGGGVSDEQREAHRIGQADLVARLLEVGADAEYELTGLCHLPLRCSPRAPRFRQDALDGEFGDTLVLVHPYGYDRATRKRVPTVIRWSGIPNENMKAANEAAEQIFDAWKRSMPHVRTPVPLAPVERASFATADRWRSVPRRNLCQRAQDVALQKTRQLARPWHRLLERIRLTRRMRTLYDHPTWRRSQKTPPLYVRLILAF